MPSVPVSPPDHVPHRVLKLETNRDLGRVLALAREGDEAAYALLVEVYEPGLRKTARNIVGSPLRSEIDPEDLIQSVHWSLWTSLCRGKLQVESAERLQAVARAILLRKVARIWRTVERRKKLATRLVGEIRPADHPTAVVDESEVDPTHQISADDQFEQLCKIMTPTERQLIELRLLGYTTAEAARKMGRPSENLRVTLARLRARLRSNGILTDFASTPSNSEDCESKDRAENQGLLE